jgi:hypothetical protein
MPRYRPRIEFRRVSDGSPWVIAGVLIAGRFWPAQPTVAPIAHRLPAVGLVGWSDLPSPVVAPTVEAAAAIALDVARATWPERAKAEVPFARPG